MRILCLSDLHGNNRGVSSLSKLAASVDLVLLAGDLTEFGGREEVQEVLRGFQGLDTPLAAVGGNCDRAGARKALEDLGISVDGGSRSLPFGQGRLSILGSGGGGFKTGLTPYERREAELAGALENGVASVEGYSGGSFPLVVLSHNPPWGTDADCRHGSHVGSKAFRDLLDALKPLLWVCGHIHESRSAAFCGPSLVVNPGPLREGFYALVQLDEAGGRPPVAELLKLGPGEIHH